MIHALCPKCGVVKKLTKHHVLPKRHFGAKGKKFFLCRKCHDELEKLIPYKKMKNIFYYKIIVEFLNGTKGGVSPYTRGYKS